jgi:AAA+ ATPase superfamily predicted ATPase
LFLAIETSPIFAKLLSPKGEFDFRLEDQETRIKTWTSQQVVERKLILKTDNDINNKVYTEIGDEEEIMNYKRKKARELLQHQADAFLNKQKGIL